MPRRLHGRIRLALERRRVVKKTEKRRWWEEFRERFREKVQEELTEDLRVWLDIAKKAWISEREYRASRLVWLRAFTRAFWMSIEHFFRRRAFFALATYALLVWGIDYLRRRAAFVYMTKDEHGKWKLVSEMRKEKVVLDTVPRAEWRKMADELLRLSEQKSTALEVLPPALRELLRFYMGYYRDRPCRHASADIKVTPFTIQTLTGKKMTGFTIRWAPRGQISESDTVRRTRPMDIRVSVDMRRKPRYAPYTAKLPSFSTDDLQTTTPAYLGRTGLGEPRLAMRILEAHLRPSLMKREFARNIGMAETYQNIDHCSLYAIPRVRSKIERWPTKEYMRKAASYEARARMTSGREPWWSYGYHYLAFVPDELFEPTYLI